MGQKFPGKVSRHSQNSWTSEMRTIQPKLLEIPGAKLNGKKTSGKKFPKIWGYLARLSGSVWKSWKMLFHPLLEVAESNRTFWLNWKRPLISSTYWAYNRSRKPKKKLRQDKETMQLSTCVVLDLSFFYFIFVTSLQVYMQNEPIYMYYPRPVFFFLLRCFNHEAKSPHMINPHENKNSLYIYSKSSSAKVHLKMHLFLQMSHYHM